MNNEIKEIIEDMQRFDNKWRNVDTKLAVATYPINQEQMPILLDYITNLQEENKELNDDNIWWNNRFKAVQRDYEDYKSRNEKAIEYIGNGNLGIPRKTRDKFIKILKGENNE